LRFVVDAALAGQADRIKGYTIGVEAFGRGEDFDPQSDPIVRVEAGRLRRALDNYYAGAKDPVVIALPVGTYVPTFTLRAATRSTAPDVAVPRSGWLRKGRGRSAVLATTLAVVVVGLGVVMHPPRHADVTGSSDRTATAAARDGTSAVFRAAGVGPGASVRQSGFGMPMVYVPPFVVIGAPPAAADGIFLLHNMLVDALARFDEIEVSSAPNARAGSTDTTSLMGPGERSLYELATTAEYADDGGIKFGFRLVDLREGTVAWSESFDGSRVGRDEIIRELATALAQPYGAIYAREREKRTTPGRLDPRYACLLDAFEAWPRYDAVKDDQVRGCLLPATTSDPSFAAGFAALSTLYFREYAFDFRASGGDEPALERALAAAQRAVALKPESARAHQALMGTHFFRGELAQTVKQGDRAVALNPYDMYTAGDYGTRLVFMGEIDKGSALLRRFFENRKAPSIRANFALFLAAHLTGHDKTASFHARQITDDRFPLGLLARAVTAEKAGDRAKAARELARLFALNAAWRDDPRGELAKFFPSPQIVERLAGDLAGLSRGDTGFELTGSTPAPGKPD
jgi:hypothetical protein